MHIDFKLKCRRKKQIARYSDKLLAAVIDTVQLSMITAKNFKVVGDEDLLWITNSTLTHFHSILNMDLIVEGGGLFAFRPYHLMVVAGNSPYQFLSLLTILDNCTLQPSGLALMHLFNIIIFSAELGCVQ